MRKALLIALAVFAAVCVMTYASVGLASRNSGGTYTLPQTSFVAGTTILSASVNSDFNDVQTEITDSLSRSGKGGMLAALSLVNGSAGTPGLNFISEASSGFYRAGTGDLRLSIGSGDVAQWIAGAYRTVDGSLAAPGHSFISETGTGLRRAGTNDLRAVVAGTDVLQLTLAPTNGTAILGTSAAAAGSTGVDFILNTTSTRSAGNLFAVRNAGTNELLLDTGGNVTFNGGATIGGAATINGVATIGGGSLTLSANSPLLRATFSDSSLILQGNRNAGSATFDVTLNSAATRTNGGLLDIENNFVSKLQVDKDGYVAQKGANPSATTAFTNTTTPLNVVKAWANVSASCSTSSASTTDGFNVSSVSATNSGNGTVTVNFATLMADTNYIVVFNGWTTTGAGAGCTAGLTKTTSSFTCTGNVSLVTGTSTWYFVVYGRQ
jgi:hypothetical protein